MLTWTPLTALGAIAVVAAITVIYVFQIRKELE
jgi:hypothetical protein